MAPTTEISRDRFLDLLSESGLLSEEALREGLASAPDSPRAKNLARHLVQAGLLTRFQAQQLLAGRSNGFFLGQYRILDLIGQGGMGKVYQAEHMTMSRLVALKLLSSDMTRTERARQLFRREVKAAARLVHPHIATAFDANEVNGRAFLVLEYIAGPSLSHLVREQGPLPVGQACEFLRQAALGLQHAHEFGMVHRDIKPSNLLIQPAVGRDTLEGGTLKIVDFGLALLADSNDDHITTDRHIVLGTPDYLAPEQARDLRSVDIRADLYGLGCTFYFMLTGQVPFPGGSALEKVTRHANDEPEPIEELRPVVPPGVVAVAQKLMAKAPADRYQTPRELADAIARYCEIHPVSWSGTRRDSAPSWVMVDGPDPDDRSDPSSSGNTAANFSGTVSIAELAATLTAAERAAIRVDDSDPGLRAKFLLAILFGFLLGVALIVVAWLLR